jgi:TPR repeat protein
MNQLGIMSISGFGGSKDQQAARDWYEKAAAKGDLEGMQHLAIMLDQGSGGPADRTRAAHILLQTAKRGHLWSRTVLNGPLTFLTPQTRAALKDELTSLGFYNGARNGEWDGAARAAFQTYLAAQARPVSLFERWT